MQSQAATVVQYLQSLTADRREQLGIVRDLLNAHIQPGFEEVINWGMITWQVPLSVCPDTYNKQPLMFAALASQKQHIALYLAALYADPGRRDSFEQRYKQTGKRYNCGKSCIRFKQAQDLPLELIAETIRDYSVDQCIALYRAVHKGRGKNRKQ
jgi:uncharacterized protein YdhG (YjbR/CyaY superfamily)